MERQESGESGAGKEEILKVSQITLTPLYNDWLGVGMALRLVSLYAACFPRQSSIASVSM